MQVRGLGFSSQPTSIEVSQKGNGVMGALSDSNLKELEAKCLSGQNNPGEKIQKDNGEVGIQTL